MRTVQEDVAAYQRDRMMLYGPCQQCGGPRTRCWDVAHDGERLDVTMAMRCTRCGAGDPDYTPTKETA